MAARVKRSVKEQEDLVESEAPAQRFKDSVVNLFPYYYAHVIDTNTNITRLELGPKTIKIQRNLKIVGGDYR